MTEIGATPVQPQASEGTLSPPTSEQRLATEVLFTMAGEVTTSLSKFSAWLMAGFGGAFTLVLSHLDRLTSFVEVANVRWSVALVLVSLALAVLAAFMGAQINAGISTAKAGSALGANITGPFDINRFVTEYTRGLFFHVRWAARCAMNKALAGDHVAVARLIAKLSQIQALFVVAQGLLAIGAVCVLLCGLKG